MCDCNDCDRINKAWERKRDRLFDITNLITGDSYHNVPANQLSETINRLLEGVYGIEDLKITQQVFVKPVWTVVE